MKRLILISLLLSACGQASSNQSGCNSAEIGTWFDNSRGTLELRSNCTFYESNCDMSGTFQINGNVVTMNVTQTNKGAYCLGTGTQTCTKSLPNPNEMYITCGGYTFGYAR